ncbi:GntR family transcriptional regulator [Paenibacillus sp. 2TAB19]|uniref:GntR family transcriptional regulator n=1 Tax=Paenibacillus sp. 2TAB19 TaxID=3233003 RepID=UPI003F943AD8
MRRSRNKPLYLQVMSVLKDRILHGTYPVGTLIPSEPQLEAEFGVSKITVRAAIKELAQDGYVDKGSGKGTKVIRNTSSSKLSKLKRFTEVLVDEGYRIRKELLAAEVILTEEGSVARQLFGDRCVKIERLYRLNGAPYIYYTHYLTDKVSGIEPNDLNEQSLYDLLEERQVTLDKYRDEFSVTASAPPRAMEALELRTGKPLLKRARYSYDENGEPVEYSEGLYDTDQHHYVVNYDV